MKRKYKLGIIILISSLLTYFIYFANKEEKLSIVAFGDGIATGETSYNIDGISYNDYIKEYYDSKKVLKNFNSYTKKNYKVKDLINDIKNNINDTKTLRIQQNIHKANLITLGIGEEEIVKSAITNDLEDEYITHFLKEYDDLLFILRDLSDAKIFIIGFYENYYLDKSKVIILNSELANLALKYDCIFINISDLMLNKEYYLTDKTFYFNYKGHQAIAEMIVHSL